MPTVTLNRKEVERCIGKRLSDEYLKDRIAMLGTDLEEINEDSIVVEIFPNRPDMLSEQGFARALGSFLGINKGLRKYEVRPSSYKVFIDKTVKSVRPYTACAVVTGLQLTDERIKEIIQVQEKLHVTYGRNRKKVAIGIYPREKITFPITFFGAAPETVAFKPLGYMHDMNGKDILESHPTGKEFGHLLQGSLLFPFFKDDQGKILSMPPIINSEHVGRVTTETKDIFIECSGFEYAVLNMCLAFLVTSLADMGGKIHGVEIIDGKNTTQSPNLTPCKMEFDLPYITKRLGITLTRAKAVELLERMGYGVQGNVVLIPAYRADVLHIIDIAEDIAIAYGYENIQPKIPKVATIGQESMHEIFSRKMAELFVGLTFQEVYTYSITNAEQIQKCDDRVQPVMLANALSEDYNALRTSLVPSLLNVLKNNRNYEYPQRIFDIGFVFEKEQLAGIQQSSQHNTQEEWPECETGVREMMHVCAMICGEGVGFTEIKQVLEYVMVQLNCSCTIQEANKHAMINGRCGAIMLHNTCIGYIGEITPKVLTYFGLEYPAAALEINMHALMKLL